MPPCVTFFSLLFFRPPSFLFPSHTQLLLMLWNLGFFAFVGPRSRFWFGSEVDSDDMDAKTKDRTLDDLICDT